MNDVTAPTPDVPAKSTARPFQDSALERAFQFCKLNASIDDAFPDDMTRVWFMGCFELCAAMCGLVWPPRTIQERTMMDGRGHIHLSFPPSSPVQFFRGPFLIATVPADSPCLIGGGQIPNCDYDPIDIFPRPRTCCPPELCDCWGTPLVAKYTAGPRDACTTLDARGNRIATLPASFVMAVARAFAFVCENRGDTPMDANMLSICNALTFLNPNGVTYVM